MYHLRYRSVGAGDISRAQDLDRLSCCGFYHNVGFAGVVGGAHEGLPWCAQVAILQLVMVR